MLRRAASTSRCDRGAVLPALVPVSVLAGVFLLVLQAAAAAANLEGHGGPVKTIAISDDGAAALSGSFDYSMIYWDLGGGKPKIVKRFEDHGGAVNAVAFLSGSNRAASGSDDGTISIWDLETGKLVHRIEGHGHKVVDLAVTTDGRTLASAGWDRTVRLWDLETFKPVSVLKHPKNVNSIAFSADGTVIYSGSRDGMVRQWNARRAELLRPVLRHGWGINIVRMLPDQTSLLAGSVDGSVNVVDIAKGEVVRELGRHEGPVLSAALSERDGIALSGGGDGKIMVWSLGDWSAKKGHDNPYGPVWAMAIANGGGSVFYGSLDDFVIHWKRAPGESFEPVTSRFPRRFQVGTEVALGERQFARKCSICHTLVENGANRAGPTLYNLFGRKAGTLPGYVYSKALIKSGIVWNEKTISQLFDDGPQEVVPGTKMPLQRMTNDDERKALIVFLKKATRSEKPVDAEADKD